MFQALIYITVDFSVVIKHAAADDVGAVVIGDADNGGFQLSAMQYIKAFYLYTKLFILGCGKLLCGRGESKAAGADVDCYS